MTVLIIEAEFGPESGASQDVPRLLVPQADQRLFVDGHQLVPDLQPAVLTQTHFTSVNQLIEVNTWT